MSDQICFVLPSYNGLVLVMWGLVFIIIAETLAIIEHINKEKRNRKGESQ